MPVEGREYLLAIFLFFAYVFSKFDHKLGDVVFLFFHVSSFGFYFPDYVLLKGYCTLVGFSDFFVWLLISGTHIKFRNLYETIYISL